MIQRFTHTGFCVARCYDISLPVAAQTFGEITGSVTDASGAVISAATVTVTNTATAVERKFRPTKLAIIMCRFLIPAHTTLPLNSRALSKPTDPASSCKSAT